MNKSEKDITFVIRHEHTVGKHEKHVKYLGIDYRHHTYFLFTEIFFFFYSSHVQKRNLTDFLKKYCVLARFTFYSQCEASVWTMFFFFLTILAHYFSKCLTPVV